MPKSISDHGFDATFGPVSGKVLDPMGLLGAVEWSTRRQFERFAKRLLAEHRLRLEVRSGRRSCAEQNRLYAQGRSTSGAVVTHAYGCQSWHTLGRAVDAYVVTPAGTRTRSQGDYEKAGRLWEADFGGVWGGDFAGFGPGGDAGHFEYHPGLKISQVCPNPSNCQTAVAQWGSPTGPLPIFALAASGVVVGLAGAWLLWRTQ